MIRFSPFGVNSINAIPVGSFSILKDPFLIEAIFDQIPTIGLAIMVHSQLCDEVNSSRPSALMQWPGWPLFPPKAVTRFSTDDRLPGMMETGNFEDEIDIGTTEDQNLVFHEFPAQLIASLPLAERSSSKAFLK